MAITNLNLIPPKQVESVQTTQYTATGVTTIIDKITVTNTGNNNDTISVNLVTSGSADDSNLIVDAVTILPGKTYQCPELIGQVLMSNSFISTLASSSSFLTIRCSGREIS